MNRFSEREAQVVELLSQGNTYKDIAKKLIIGETTVKTHMTHIREKLELSEKHQIVAWYWKNKLNVLNTLNV